MLQMEKGGPSLGFKMFQVNWNMFAKDSLLWLFMAVQLVSQDTVLCGSAISMLSKASQLRPQQFEPWPILLSSNSLSVHPQRCPHCSEHGKLIILQMVLSIIDWLIVEYWITSGYFRSLENPLPMGFSKVAECFDAFLQHGPTAPWPSDIQQKNGAWSPMKISSPNGSARGKSRPTCSPIRLHSVHVIRVLNGFWHWNF